MKLCELIRLFLPMVLGGWLKEWDPASFLEGTHIRNSSAESYLPISRVVPEGTEVFVSAYQLHRDPRYFSPLPETFLPERWLQDPSNPPARLDTLPGPFIHDTTAFIPFSYGPQNCVGRQLAVLEIRFMVCLLVRRFDLQFPTNFNAEHWPTLYYDRFIAAVGHLPVLLTRR